MRLIHLVRVSLLFGALVAAGAAGAACGPLTGDDHPRQAIRRGDCASCHIPEYEATTAPPHAGLFPTTCGDCHAENAWVPAVAFGGVRHDWFPLRNRHAEVACTDCHTSGFAPGATASSCVGCHREDALVAVPSHAGFSEDCASCHTDAGWRPAGFDHPWPLDGRHAVAACASCHTGTPPRYAGTPTECVGCHRADQDRAITTVSGHSGFGTGCASCHSTAAWRPAGFDHPWPLEGAHATAACASCHTGTPPRYAGTPADCASCHRDDHDRAIATVTGHSGFGTGCASCHSSTAWRPATGGGHPDDVFRISSGRHMMDCASCHDASLGPDTDGANTDCIGCHTGEHTLTRMDEKHSGERDYAAERGDGSNRHFCLSCHPGG